jgi:hypothetical protein
VFGATVFFLGPDVVRELRRSLTGLPSSSYSEGESSSSDSEPGFESSVKSKVVLRERLNAAALTWFLLSLMLRCTREDEWTLELVGSKGGIDPRSFFRSERVFDHRRFARCRWNAYRNLQRGLGIDLLKPLP